MNEFESVVIEIKAAKRRRDLIALKELIDIYKESPIIEQVKFAFDLLKNEEIERVKKDPFYYDPHYLLVLIDKGIFTKQVLIDTGVVTESVYERLINYATYSVYPDFGRLYEDCELKCEEGSTDVFFWGVNGVGKSNLLMGLMNAKGCYANLANKYAAYLTTRFYGGIVAQFTHYHFASSIHTHFVKNGKLHKVNLIDYDGQTLVKDILYNDIHTFKLADIDTKVTRSLQNSNRKIFFILIDSLLENFRMTREILLDKDEETGKPCFKCDYVVINQKKIIRKLFDLFCCPENADIMKKVDAIHFIVTKADCLGYTHVERLEEARKLFSSKYGDGILEECADLCREYFINNQTNFQPQIYTFSLGKLCVGGLFEFDPTDANVISDVIVENSTADRKSFKDKILRLFRM